MSAFVASMLFARRDLKVATSYRLAFVMTSLSAVLSLVTFRFISELVGDAAAIRATGDYFGFVVVGIVLASVLDGALAGPAAQVRQEQIQGTLEVLATQPLSTRALAAGWATYPLGNALASGAVTVIVAAVMGLRVHAASWPAALLALLLASVVFAALGLLIAAFVTVFQQGAGLTNWISAGLALVSGVYFPLALFPGWLRALSVLSPLTHALRVVRGTLLEGKGFGAVAGDLASLAVLAAVALPIAVAALGAALRRARKRGTITTY